MEKEEKIKVLLDAVKEGKVSKRQLDIKGKGKAILKLEQGLDISEDKIEEMYQTLANLSASEKSQGISSKREVKKATSQLGKIREDQLEKIREPMGEKLGKKLSTQLEKIREEYKTILKVLDSITSSLSSLSDEQRKIKDKVERICGILEKSRQGDTPQENEKGKEEATNIQGFTLVQKKKEGGRYWYAAKTKEGKTKWIYIGKEKDNAEEKIKAWLEKQR